MTTSGDSSKSTTAHTALSEIDDDGAFRRTASSFTSTIEVGGRFEPEANRYHLYVALACPWAAGTLAALKHKGLDSIVGYSVVHPTWRRTRPDIEGDEHCGWHFANPGDPPVQNSNGYGSFDCDDALIPDRVNGAKTIRDLYEMAGDTSGKYSTPVLWDRKEKTIVNNESMLILKIFDEAFCNLLGSEGEDTDRPNLFPPDLQSQAEEWNELIYNAVNNGVYKCGFATSQSAYETAHSELFAALDKLEAHFGESGHTFLMGDTLTWLDIRLYCTLVRFDPVYVIYFKTSHKRIGSDYPNLLKFVRACYREAAIRDTTNIKHIKMHYFTSHPTLNAYGIIPVSNGPPLETSTEGEHQ